MTTQSTEEPLDRLNYFNGQRLEASDLRTEQDYHIRVRRLLNQALYTPGIADGLEVSPADGNPHAVTVGAGVALDALGRELILLEPVEIPVQGLPNSDPSWVYGNYLYIQYAEEEAAAIGDGCTLASESCDLAWGGPSRIRAQPLLGFADQWPNEAEGQVILAQVELDPSCAVAQIHNQVRKYVDAAKSSTTAVSYEGEKDIDLNNPKKLTFHVLGAPASSVTLYLWADELTSLYYTQLGAHEHGIPELETELQQYESGAPTDEKDLYHTHEIDLSGLETEEDGVHGTEHDVWFPAHNELGNKVDVSNSINVGTTPDAPKWLSALNFDGTTGHVTGGKHKHSLKPPGANGIVPSGPPTPDLTVSTGEHRHTINASTTESTGQGNILPLGTTTPLTFLDDLQIILDGEIISRKVRSLLGGPSSGWDKLGDGSENHGLVAKNGGTGAIALERIASLNQGDHTLVFRVDNDSGGNLRYNLYVE